MTRSGSRSKRWLLVALAILIVFFSIALFSPLHRHTPGKAGGCSFNNLEHQWFAAGELAVVVLILLDLALRVMRDEFLSILAGTPRDFRGRAPPIPL
ncbi:MAG: hypothetical protein HYX27_07945 [Acidobacteria bacterium]|nr:hypothetical protein [Acidobacteriota bacterium]